MGTAPSIPNIEVVFEFEIAIHGSNRSNYMVGGWGETVIYGYGGDDLINGDFFSDTRVWQDTLIGGLGNDTYYVNSGKDVIIEYNNEGMDIVNSLSSYTLNDNIETLILMGNSNINGVGNGSDNLIMGSSGNNIINGKTGNDTLIGYAGNDSYYIDQEKDMVIELVNEGIDSVYSPIAYTLSDNFENLILTGSNNLTGAGNDLENIITGNSDNDILCGEGGNDKLYSGKGNDTLSGGIGNDTIYGGQGSDTYIFNRGDGQDILYDVKLRSHNADQILFGTGISDLIFTKKGENLIIQIKDEFGKLTNDCITILNQFCTSKFDIEKFIFTQTRNNLPVLCSSINASANNYEVSTYDIKPVINGSNNKDKLTGSIIDDNISAFAGNDIINAKNGNDTVNGGVGNDSIYGETGNDVLNGNEGNDKLYGESGNDTLIGSLGNDFLYGGDSDDTYIFGLGDGSDIISDYSKKQSNDLISFDNNVSKDNIAFFMQGSNLIISYSYSDQITVLNQKNSKYAIEKIRLNDGHFLSAADINNIIQSVTSYDKAHTELTITNVNDVKSNTELMTYITAQWHST